MLFIRTLLITKSRVIIPTQSLSTSIKLYSSSKTSSSNSSDSSDSSDSDTEVEKTKGTKQSQSKPEAKSKFLDDLLNDLIKNKQTKKTHGKQINFAVDARKLEKKDTKQPNVSYASMLTKAAADVGQHLGDNTTHTKSQLLSTLQKKRDRTERKPTNQKEKSTSDIIKDLLTDMRLPGNVNGTAKWKSKAAVARKLTEFPNENSTFKNNNRSQRVKITPLSQYTPTGVFRNMNKPAAEIPELATWKALEQRELDLLLFQSPRNIFQEMIQWTEQGKLWKFPIDNEIDLEEEHNVHFSEHVFLERHLKDWCPKRGPIRHFMELVCVGLSKNPYMTANEKMDHINWYKEYFKDKEDLLKEVGAIDTPMSNKPDVIKE